VPWWGWLIAGLLGGLWLVWALAITTVVGDHSSTMKAINERFRKGSKGPGDL